jgi:activator of Hsp90 ATPase-like protein
MTTTDFTLTLTTEQTPNEVFKAITNVRGWWSGYYSEKIEGSTDKPGDEFSFRAGDGVHYSKQKLVEVIPNQKVVWLITESELSFVGEKHEWTGTKVIFDISEKGGKTELVFTHEGLNPEFECYEACAPTWAQYLRNKLLPLINTGKVQ